MEGNISIFISIEFIEDPYKIFSKWFDTNEEAGFNNKSDEFFQTNSAILPNIIVIALISSFEKDFNEVNGKNNCNKFLESNGTFFTSFKVEVVKHKVVNFIAVQFENFRQNVTNFIIFEDLIFVVVI